MFIKINKKLILENQSVSRDSRFMLGVNHGFHDSILPHTIIKSYSDLNTIKPKDRYKESAISHDLGIRLASMAASKATVGGATYMGLEGLKDLTMDKPDDIDQAFTVIPAVAASWLTSDFISKKVPKYHRHVLKDKSIYMKPKD